jgi:hypothetical protein
MKMRIFAATAGVALLAAVGAHAQDGGNFALGANVGTPGLGVEAQFRLNDSLVVRGGGDWLDFDHDETYGDVAYKGKIKSKTGGVFLDWHPMQGGFFVSGGSYFGKRKLNLAGTPTRDTQIGGVTFTPAQIGTITGDVELSDAQPFVGLGWDNTFTRDGAWGFRAMAGVSFSDSPKVDLTASGGTLSNDPTFQQRLREEEAEVRDDAKDFKYFPVAQVGVTYRF